MKKKHIRKILKTMINIILIGLIIYYMTPVVEKTVNTYENKQTYSKAVEEKEEIIETKSSDWITIPGTNINYPVMWKEKDNSYYLKHDVYGNESNHGSIFYDGGIAPYSTHVTTLYGHCMRDGSMFNNLHYFRTDEQKFLSSELIIERSDGTTHKYRPLGLYVTNENFFYNKLHLKTLDESISIIQEHSVYDIDIEYNQNADILTLMTCSYEHEGDRFFVFYISE